MTVNQARCEEPDCVVADIRMPEISGLELPGLLAKRGIRVPVIFVTAYDIEENRAEARRAGAAAFFHKPIDGQALLDAVAWVVEATDNGEASFLNAQPVVPVTVGEWNLVNRVVMPLIDTPGQVTGLPSIPNPVQGGGMQPARALQ